MVTYRGLRKPNRLRKTADAGFARRLRGDKAQELQSDRVGKRFEQSRQLFGMPPG